MIRKQSKLGDVFHAVLCGDLSGLQAAIKKGESLDSLDRDGRTPLFHAVIDGNIALVDELLAHGANVNVQDNNLETPLHFAAREYRPELVEILLNHGSNVDAQDADGNTPLSGAVFASRGRGEVIALLLKHSADKMLKNKHGVSPEDLAGSIGNYDVRKFLSAE